MKKQNKTKGQNWAIKPVARFNHSTLSGQVAVRLSVNWFRDNVKNPHLRRFVRMAWPVTFLGLPMIHLSTVYVAPKLLTSHLSPRLGCGPLAGREQALYPCMLNERTIPSSRPGPCRAGVNIPGVSHPGERPVVLGQETRTPELQRALGRQGRVCPSLGPPAILGKKEPRVCRGHPWRRRKVPQGGPPLPPCRGPWFLPRLP